MSVKSYKLAGCIWLTPVDEAGALTGERRKAGNVYPMSVQVAVKTVEKKSAMCENAGQIVDSRSDIDTISGAMTMHQWDAATMGYAVGATPMALTGTGGTIASQNVTAPALGTWADIGKQGLSDVVVKDETDATTYVLGTDYLLNTQLGFISPIAGGGIAEGDVLHVSATYAAQTGYRLSVGTVLQNRVRIDGALRDIATGQQVNFLAYSALITAESGVNMISDPETDYEELPFAIKFITPSGYTTPVVIDGMTD